jgi:hypothetical protein
MRDSIPALGTVVASSSNAAVPMASATAGTGPPPMKKRVKEEFDDDEETSTIGDIEDSAGMERCAVYNYPCAIVPYNPVPELFNEPDRVFVALLLPLDARDPEVHVTEDCTHLKVAYRWPASIENMAVVLAGWEDAVKERFHPLATGFKKALNDSAKDLGILQLLWLRWGHLKFVCLFLFIQKARSSQW